MVEKLQTFAERFLTLKGEMSFERLSDAVYDRTGVRVSGQAMHKWVTGGGITLSNVKAVADYFDVSPAWLLFGDESETKKPTVDDLIRDLPAEQQQLNLNLLDFSIERAEHYIAREKVADYHKMIEQFKLDLLKRKNNDDQR